MAGPMLGLYGFSILIAWIFAKRGGPGPLRGLAPIPQVVSVTVS